MPEHNNTLAEMLETKRDFLRLVTLAIVLSFSVGVLASLVAASNIVPTWAIYAGAALLIIASLIMLTADIRQKLTFEDHCNGLLFIDAARNELVEVRGYELSKDLSRALAAVKAENRAIYSEWENDPLVVRKGESKAQPISQDVVNKPKDDITYISIVRVEVEDNHHTKQKASQLLDEALQFVLLEELSTHLSTYFTNSKSDQVSELNREDIPAFLLQNRVLNLLTTPIEQRDVFLKAFPNKSERPEGVICSLWGSDGSMYSRFDLNLPKGSKVSHTGRGSLRIETKRLDLEISGRYTGSSGVVSPPFVEHYVGKPWDDVDCRKIKVVLRGRIKPLALISDGGWEHYRWLDSFRSRLKQSADFDAFLHHIHWDSIEPTVYALRGRFSAINRNLRSLSKSTDGDAQQLLAADQKNAAHSPVR